MEKKKKTFEIGELDGYLFGQGNHYEIYKKLGSHMVRNGKTEGVYFAVWAPNARSVSVVGEFNEWDMRANPMEREENIGIYTCFIPGVKKYSMYKYCIETFSGQFIFKADPFANHAELRPGTASKVVDIENLRHGLIRESRGSARRSRSQSMRYTLDPGRGIWDGRTRDIILTVSLPGRLLLM